MKQRLSFSSFLGCLVCVASVLSGCGRAPDEFEETEEIEGSSSSVTSCPAGYTLYNGSCIDLMTNSSHCGRIGLVCSATTGCFGGKCTIPAPFPYPRSVQAVTVGTDGRIYVTGGFKDVGIARNDVYNPRTNTWTTMASQPQGGMAPSALAADGTIHLISGNIHWFFSPLANVWKSATPAIDQRVYFEATSAQGRPIRVLGGLIQTAGAENSRAHRVLNGGTWTFGPPMRMGRVAFGTATSPVDGKVYVLGGNQYGFIGSGPRLSSVEIFNPSTSTWSAGPPLPSARTWIKATAGLDGKIYATGGWYEWSRFDIYSPSTQTWRTGPPLPPPHAGWGYAYTGMVTGKDGRIYVIGGGYPGKGVYPSAVDVFDPKRNRWVGY